MMCLRAPLIGVALALLSASAVGGDTPSTSRPAAVSSLGCDDTDPYCAAANLSRLYSAGAAAATTECVAQDQDCEAKRSKSLAIAAGRYRSYLAALRSRDLDPTLAGKFGEHANGIRSAAIENFVDSMLGALAKPCGLASHDCVRARVYLLADVDQAVRRHPVCTGDDEEEACRATKRAAMARVDAASSAVVRKILRDHGWLTADEWGRATDDEFWLLVQHADADPDLQKHALEVLKSNPHKDSSAIHRAYLEDRVRVHEKRPQLYGTQGRCGTADGVATWQPEPIEDASRVDERRAELHLGSLEDYAKDATQACGRF